VAGSRQQGCLPFKYGTWFLVFYGDEPAATAAIALGAFRVKVFPIRRLLVLQHALQASFLS
jgi:hypothetical protein